MGSSMQRRDRPWWAVIASCRIWWHGLQRSAAPTLPPACASTTCSPWIHARIKQLFSQMPMHMPIVTPLKSTPRRSSVRPFLAAKRKMAGVNATANALASYWEATSGAWHVRRRLRTGIPVLTKVWRKHSTRGPVQEWREPGVTSSTRWTGSDMPVVYRKSPFVRSWIITIPDTPRCTEVTVTAL